MNQTKCQPEPENNANSTVKRKYGTPDVKENRGGPAVCGVTHRVVPDIRADSLTAFHKRLLGLRSPARGNVMKTWP